MHQLPSPIFHLGINFHTIFGLTSFSGKGFPFDLTLLKKKNHVGFSFIPNSNLPPRLTFRTFRIQKYINKISIPFPIKDVRLFE